jgi:hypothetical protein
MLRTIYLQLAPQVYNTEGHNVHYVDLYNAARRQDKGLNIVPWDDAEEMYGAQLYTESWFLADVQWVVLVKEDDCGKWASLK